MFPVSYPVSKVAVTVYITSLLLDNLTFYVQRIDTLLVGICEKIDHWCFGLMRLQLLDWLLGKDSSTFLGRGQLRTLVDLLSVKAGRGGELTDDETTIITGALDMTEKTAKDAMTPISKTFSLDITAVLDMHTMGLIMSKGHSRVPFYSGNPKNIIGLVLVKNLIFCDPEEKVPLQHITLRRIPRVYDNWPLYDVLKLFQKGHSHMAVVVRSHEHGNGEIKVKQTTQFRDIASQSNSPLSTTQVKGDNSPFRQGEPLTDSLNPTDIEAQINTFHNVGTPTPCSNLSDQSSKWEEEVGNISPDELESLKDKYTDEEVIGIITMEDVMEELLQEEILDETDLNVLHKIRMHHLPWTIKSTASSPGWSTGSQIQWKTPATSDFSSYYNTPILHSPMSPHSPSTLMRPTAFPCSPGKSNLGSPSGFQIRWSTPSSSFSSGSYNTTPVLNSPMSPYVPSPLTRPTLQASPRKSNLGSPSSASWYAVLPLSPSKQVSRKSYEKLRNAGIS
ncbi:OLC1v1027506C3 [Oldenlandia corymbosa var. corymbosa]|nr:OLC1v1027506C3 [Oldenlandia corymbosa var. corymbosa]